MKQCSVLIVNTGGRELPQRRALEKVGFRVMETDEWPADEMVRHFEVVVVRLRDMKTVGMVAARMRAKPHFGRRVLIAVAPGTASSEQRRAATGNGFDDVVPESRHSRVMIARIRLRLRSRPEHECSLPDTRSAA